MTTQPEAQDNAFCEVFCFFNLGDYLADEVKPVEVVL